jgi:hypothetical protein
MPQSRYVRPLFNLISGKVLQSSSLAGAKVEGISEALRAEEAAKF